MIRHAAGACTLRTDNGYRVEMPRAHDAIGVVLRDAYARDAGIPDDMASLLKQMDAPSQAGRRQSDAWRPGKAYHRSRLS